VVQNPHVAGAAEIAGRPVTCEHGWINRCRTQLTAQMPERAFLQELFFLVGEIVMSVAGGGP